MLPDISGYTVLKEIRKISEVPVIILSARSPWQTRWADLRKVQTIISPSPLLWLLWNATLRRCWSVPGSCGRMVEYNDLQADVNAQLLFYKEQHIPTTRKEFDLIVYFMEHPGIVLPRDTILNAVWEYRLCRWCADHWYSGEAAAEKNLEEGCNYIRTVYGVGYIFGEDSPSEN